MIRLGLTPSRAAAALLTLVGALLLVPLGAAPAPAATPGSVVLRVVGGPTRTFTAADLADPALQDVPGAPYALREESGAQRSAGGDGWVSLRALLAAAGGPSPAAVTWTEVSGPDGVVHPLGRGELAGGFAGGLVPAVSAQPGGVTYVRPLRGGGDANLSPDANRQGYEQTTGALTIVLHTSGSLLDVDVAPTRTAPDSYTLKADVADAPSGLTAAWTLGDGSEASGLSVEHSWSKPGSYPIGLQVRAPDGSWGRAAPASVQVEAARPTPSPSPSPTPSPTPTAQPSAQPSDEPSAQPSGQPSVGGPRGVAPGGGRPLGRLASVPTAPSGRQLSALSAGGEIPLVRTPSARPTGPQQYRVTGVLLGAQPAAATTAAEVPRTVGSALLLPPWVAHLMIVLGLIGLGVLRETSGVLRRRSPVSQPVKEQP